MPNVIPYLNALLRKIPYSFTTFIQYQIIPYHRTMASPKSKKSSTATQNRESLNPEHPRSPGRDGGPFSALDSNGLPMASLKTKGASTPYPPSPGRLTHLVLGLFFFQFFCASYRTIFCNLFYSRLAALKTTSCVSFCFTMIIPFLILQVLKG